jgi:hypothetical protein
MTKSVSFVATFASLRFQTTSRLAQWVAALKLVP